MRADTTSLEKPTFYHWIKSNRDCAWGRGKAPLKFIVHRGYNLGVTSSVALMATSKFSSKVKKGGPDSLKIMITLETLDLGL